MRKRENKKVMPLQSSKEDNEQIKEKGRRKQKQKYSAFQYLKSTDSRKITQIGAIKLIVLYEIITHKKGEINLVDCIMKILYYRMLILLSKRELGKEQASPNLVKDIT